MTSLRLMADMNDCGTAHTSHSPIVGSMLFHRLGEYLLFAVATGQPVYEARGTGSHLTYGADNIDRATCERVTIPAWPLHQQPSKHETFNRCWFNVSPPSTSSAQH